MIGAGALKKRAAEKKRSRRVSNTAETQNDLLRSQPKVSRRGFLAGGAAGALTLSGCARRPVEHILPYVEGPEYQLPGQPIHFASVTKRGDDALGLLVTSHVGRPTKIEGNPRHSRSLGATDLRAQLAIWDLYDPDRSQGPAERSGEAGLEDRSVAQFDAALDAAIASHAERGGTGLRVLMEPTNSPSMVRIRRRLAERFPQAKVHTYTSIDTDNAREGGELAFGQPVSVVYNLSGADVVLALDSDFLGDEHGSVRNGKAFASRRKITNPESDRMNRLYAVEGNFSLTGANADHRLRLPPRQIGGFLKALAAVIDDGPVPEAFGDQRAFLQALAADLKSAGARGLILVGRRQPPAVHAAAHALNDRLGAYGSSPADRARLASFQTVTVDERKRGTESIAELASATDVQTLLIFGVNGVYNAPADVDFTGLLARNGVKSFYFGSHRDETAQRCSWHYPLAHELESWGDQRAADGTVSVQQPLIQPLWGGRSALEVLAKAAGERNWRGHYVVRKTFRDSTNLGDGFEARWRAALHNGVVAGSMTRPIRPPLQAAARSALDSLETVAAPTAQDLEVVFAADPRVWDGRHTNNLWALESPDPITKMVWDNAALMSRATMGAL
ncbi:MAG: molybdopterin oxidoreductase, partial [Myxococcota bacterium]